MGEGDGVVGLIAGVTRGDASSPGLGEVGGGVGRGFVVFRVDVTSHFPHPTPFLPLKVDKSPPPSG